MVNGQCPHRLPHVRYVVLTIVSTWVDCLLLDPEKLLGNLELAFILVLYLSSYSALMVYKRILALFCRSTHILVSAGEYLSTKDTDSSLRQAYTASLDTLASQLKTLPDSAFETELPEMDVFYLEELEALRENLGTAYRRWNVEEQALLDQEWNRLRSAVKDKWGWQIATLTPPPELGDDDDLDGEEGEYAPIIVET